jgi:hypothetical protein
LAVYLEMKVEDFYLKENIWYHPDSVQGKLSVFEELGT